MQDCIDIKDNNEFLEAAHSLWEKLYLEDWKDEYIDSKFKLVPEDKERFLKIGHSVIQNILYKISSSLTESFGAYTILQKERKTTSKINGIDINGIIDLVIETENNQKIVFDYKLVNPVKWKSPEEIKMHQLNLYKYLIREEYGNIEQSVFIIIPRTDNPKSQLFFVKNTLPEDKTLSWIDNIAFGINNNAFWKNRGKNCYMCQFNKTEHCQ